MKAFPGAKLLQIALVVTWGAALLGYAIYARAGALEGNLPADELAERSFDELPVQLRGGDRSSPIQVNGIVFISRYCDVCKREARAIVRASRALGKDSTFFVLVREQEPMDDPLPEYPSDRLLILTDDSSSWGKRVAHVPTFIDNSDGRMRRVWTGVPNRLQIVTYRVKALWR